MKSIFEPLIKNVELQPVIPTRARWCHHDSQYRFTIRIHNTDSQYGLRITDHSLQNMRQPTLIILTLKLHPMVKICRAVEPNIMSGRQNVPLTLQCGVGTLSPVAVWKLVRFPNKLGLGKWNTTQLQMQWVREPYCVKICSAANVMVGRAVAKFQWKRCPFCSPVLP